MSRRAEEIANILREMSQRQFFYYCQSKLRDAIDDELKLDKPTYLFGVSGSSVNEYKERLTQLRKGLLINLDSFPSQAFQAVGAVIKTIKKEHPIFKEVLPLDLFLQKYQAFYGQVGATMYHATWIQQFNFSNLSPEQKTYISAFASNRISKNIEDIQNEMQRTTDPLEKAVFGFQIISLTMEYAFAYSDNDAIQKAFNTSEITTTKRLYKDFIDSIQMGFSVTNRMRMAAVDKPIIAPPAIQPIIAPPAAPPSIAAVIPVKVYFDYARLKNEGIQFLTWCIDSYASKAMAQETLSETEIQNVYQMKKWRAELIGLSPNDINDSAKITAILKYILRNPFHQNLSELNDILWLSAHPGLANRLRAENPRPNRLNAPESEFIKEHALLMNEFNRFSENISDSDLEALENQVKKPARQGFFYRKSNEDEVDGPPKRDRTLSPGSRK